MEDVKDKVFQVIADYLSVDIQDLDMDQSLDEDLNVNEVELAEIIAEIEELFGIDIDKEELKKLDKISDLVELVEDLQV